MNKNEGKTSTPEHQLDAVVRHNYIVEKQIEGNWFTLNSQSEYEQDEIELAKEHLNELIEITKMKKHYRLIERIDRLIA